MHVTQNMQFSFLIVFSLQSENGIIHTFYKQLFQAANGQREKQYWLCQAMFSNFFSQPQDLKYVSVTDIIKGLQKSTSIACSFNICVLIQPGFTAISLTQLFILQGLENRKANFERTCQISAYQNNLLPLRTNSCLKKVSLMYSCKVLEKQHKLNLCLSLKAFIMFALFSCEEHGT